MLTPPLISFSFPSAMTPGRKRSLPRGWTLVELLTGVAIIAVLLVLSLAGLQQMRTRTQAMTCIAHLHADFLGFSAWFGDHQNWMPPGPSDAPIAWYVPLFNGGYLPRPSGVTPKTRFDKTAPTLCPANTTPRDVSNAAWTNYAVNGWLYHIGGAGSSNAPRKITEAKGAKILLIDCWTKPQGTWYYTSGPGQAVDALHGRSVNVLFLDGHIESPKVDGAVKNAAGDVGELKGSWYQLP